MFFISHLTLSFVVSLYAVVDGRSTALSNIGELHLRKKPADPVKTIKVPDKARV